MFNPLRVAMGKRRKKPPMTQRRWIRATAVTGAAVMLGGILGTDIAAAAGKLSLPRLDEVKPVPVSEVKTKKAGGRDDAARDARRGAPKVTWPQAATAEAELPERRGATRRAGKLPVLVGLPESNGKAKAAKDTAPPESAEIRVLDRATTKKLGVEGVVLAVRGTGGGEDGRVRVTLDYSGFEHAYGAGWASRLSFVRLPACALEKPDDPKCARTEPLATDNDTDSRTLTADVPVDATAEPSGDAAGNGPKTMLASAAEGVTLLAATAAPSGAGGDYKATPLSPSGRWTAGTSSGGFTWAYGIQTPETPGGLEPELSLSYNSQSLDGRTAATNNQANWVGDGWSLTENYIERRYISCNDDKTGGNNTANNGELCWHSDNATMSLEGQSHELVRDDATGTWKLKDDDGTRIERLKDTARGNGDNDGEYWRITTTDGTQYYFGYNRLPGWTSGKPETDSTWTVPVYGNQSGEPCHKTAFADSWCKQAWRWNLDYVVDPNGNATAYYYASETNRYARNANAATGLGTVTAYERGGHPLRIEYGLRADNVYDTDAAMAKVEFTVAERCLPDDSFDCAPSKMTAANAKRWPDVPVDQYCREGEDCKGKIAPTFWTTKRLTKITTKVLAGGTYAPVDSWELRHELPDPGDGSTPTLWLAGITRAGHTAGSSQKLPEVTFLGQQLANRVDTTGDGIPPIVRYRVRQVNTETGSAINVTYSEPECTPGNLPAEATNTKRCYPVYWSSADSPAADYKPVKDWFHKYVVTRVLEDDLVGGSPAQQTDYTYVGGAAWAKSEDELTKPEHRTYSDFRGYGEVRTQVGNGTDGPKLDTRTRYFRGIEGAKVADFEGNEVDDHPAFAGMERAEAEYNDGELISEETTTPWRKGPTASRARPGLSALTAYMTDVAVETTRSPLKGGGWQRTKSERTFDEYGMLASETDHGDTAKTGDETCTTMTYARNTGANILELEASEKTTAGTCADPGELISEERTYYDGSTTLGAAPTRGNATRQDENDDKGTGFITVATTSYDAYGRPVKVTDAQNRAMTTEYTPATGMPTRMVVTNPLGHTLTTELDAERGVPVAEIDANGKRTDIAYDALGRVTKVWEPGRSKSRYPDSPSAAYEYRISRTEAPAITTRELRGDGSTETSYTLYDGLLRERQVQMPALGKSGRVLTETLYDSRGLEWKIYDHYYATGDPEPTLVAGDDTKAPAAVRIEYDGAGRQTKTIALKYGTETRRVTTVYDGNHTTVIPPKGGTARTTVTDALNRPIEEIEYTNEARTASQSTKYAYNARGLLERVTDPAGTVRTFAYDARGREIRSDDPDQGRTTYTYDVMDRKVSATNARGVTLTTVYDALGRTTAVKEGSELRSEWVYDTVAKGEITEARRYVNGQAYTHRITGYTDDYQPTGVQVTIPSAEGALAGTYTWEFDYNDKTGLLTGIEQPALGDLPAERVVTRYDADDQAQGLTAGGRILVNSTTYDPFGRPLRTEYNDQLRRIYRSWSYDEHTGELLRVTTDRTMAPQRVDDTHYTYDLAGNVKRIKTTTGQGEEQQTDTQCFVTDALQRLTEAWTATDDCAEGPSRSTVGGPRPYWMSYTYDALGNRIKEVHHDTNGDPAKDTVRTYAYGGQGEGKGGPNALTSVETTRDGKTETDTFTYDETGNTVTRKTGSRDQTLVWDAENQLAKVEEPGKATTEYIYDTNGERLLRKDGEGTTLYLPGGNELLLQPNGKKTGVRYYEFDGETVAVRTGDDLEFLFGDHHGTGTTAIDATTQEVVHRWLDPFGVERGAHSSPWPVDRGFVGGIMDGTGLTQLGARAYDPALGRFISVDPLVDYTEAQRINPYAYANNNPVTFSDPDGLFFGKIKNAIKKTVKKVVKTVKKVVKKAVKKVKKVVKKVKKVVKRAVKKVKKAVKKVARAVKKVVKRAVRAVKKFAKKTYKAVKRTYAKVKAKVKTVAKKAVSVAKKVGRTIADGAKKAWKAATSERFAEILGHVSTVTGTLAGVAAMIPGGQGIAAGLAAVSAGTGLASAGVYALNGQYDKAGTQLAGTTMAIMLTGAGSAANLIRGSGAVARGFRAAVGDGSNWVGVWLVRNGTNAVERGIGRGSIALKTAAANVGGWIGLGQEVSK